MMKLSAIATLTCFVLMGALYTGVQASPLATGMKQEVTRTTNPTLNRAKNLARQAAEQQNGGLSQYRAEPAMHGPAGETPYEFNADGSITFTFTGGFPGSTTPTVESIVTVDPTNWVVTIDCNGPIGSCIR